jgi:hypothetical protein
MSRYKFSLTGASLAMLCENESPLYYICEEPSSMLFVDDGDDIDEITKFDPSYEFWCELVRLNTFTSKLSEFHSSHSVYDIPDEALPDSEHFRIPYSPELPEYEAKIAHEIGRILFRKRLETNTVMKEHSELRRLFRHAYGEAEGTVPEYLKESLVG